MTPTEWMLEPIRVLLVQLQMMVPKLGGAALIVLLGWMVAGACRAVAVRLLRAIGLDRLADKAKLSDVLQRGAVRSTFVELLGHVAYWLLMTASVLVALQFMGISAASEWLERFGLFVPRILVSVVIILFGMLLGSFLGATVRAASLNAGVTQGHAVGQAVHTTTVLITFILALEQLQIVTRTIEIVLYILLGTFGLAAALAVGLGSQDLVKRFLEEKRKPPQQP